MSVINLPPNMSIASISKLLCKSTSEVAEFIATGESEEIAPEDFDNAVKILKSFASESKVYYDDKSDAFLITQPGRSSTIVPNKEIYIDPNSLMSQMLKPENCIGVSNLVSAVLTNQLYVGLQEDWNPYEVESISTNGYVKYRLKGGKRPPQKQILSFLQGFFPSALNAQKKNYFRQWIYDLILSKNPYDTAPEVSEFAELSVDALMKEIVRDTVAEMELFTSSLIEDGKSTYEIQMEGERKTCRVLNTKYHIGTIVRDFKEDVLYSSSGFVAECIKKKEFGVLGLGSIVPPVPNNQVVDTATIGFFLPHYTNFIEGCKSKFPGLPYNDYVKGCKEGINRYIAGTFSGNRGTEPNGEFGITFAENDSFTPASISRKAFYAFEATNKLPLPFQAWTNTMLSSGEYFWAMLYGMLIPEHNTPRKQSLLQFSTGGCFKSHFQNILRVALNGSLISPTYFKPSTKSTAAVSTALGRNHSHSTASSFDNKIQMQYGILQIWPEARHYNPVSPQYSKLKEELGTLRLKVEEKHENALEVPTNRTHFLDSNYPPHGNILSDDARVRLIETFLINPTRFTNRGWQKEFYFDALVLRDEVLLREATQFAERDGATDLRSYINDSYLPYLLFKSILSYGKYCYLKLADFSAMDKEKDRPVTFRPLRYEDIDRKTFCQVVFCHDKPWGFISRDEQDLMDMTTFIVNILPVILEPADRDSCVDVDVIKSLVMNMASPFIKGDSNASRKKKTLLPLLDFCFSKIDTCLGAGFTPVVTIREEGSQTVLKGVKLVDRLIKDGELSYDNIFDYCEEEVTRKYLERMEETGLSYLIADKYINDLI